MESRRRPSPPANPDIGELVRAKRAGAKPLRKEDVKHGFGGWHENGYLPHRDEPGLTQFVTFRLADAFPEKLRAEWESLLKIENDRRRRIELEAYLDKGRGSCFLARPDIAKIIEDSFICRQGEDYELLAWVVMPNHVHLLFKVLDVPMSQLMDAWKGFSAKQANKVLGRKGKFWQDGYWDTYMRNENHILKARRYIEKNPLKAGLISKGKDWPWSSVRFQDAYGRLCLPA